MIGFRRRRRRLVGGPGFQKMRVATLNMIFSVIYCLDLHNATFFTLAMIYYQVNFLMFIIFKRKNSRVLVKYEIYSKFISNT